MEEVRYGEEDTSSKTKRYHEDESADGQVWKVWKDSIAEAM